MVRSRAVVLLLATHEHPILKVYPPSPATYNTLLHHPPVSHKWPKVQHLQRDHGTKTRLFDWKGGQVVVILVNHLVAHFDCRGSVVSVHQTAVEVTPDHDVTAEREIASSDGGVAKLRVFDAKEKGDRGLETLVYHVENSCYEQNESGVLVEDDADRVQRIWDARVPFLGFRRRCFLTSSAR